MVEKITFLYFVVEMGPNLFSGHCIGSIFYHSEKLKLIFKMKAILSYSCYWLMQYCSRLYNEAVQSLQVIMENLDVCVGKLAKIYSISVLGLVFFCGIYIRLHGSWLVNYMLNYPNQDLLISLMAEISCKYLKENGDQKIMHFSGILKNILQSLGGLENTKSGWQSY